MGFTQHSGGGGKMLEVFHAENVGAREREGSGMREEREGSGGGSTFKIDGRMGNTEKFQDNVGSRSCVTTRSLYPKDTHQPHAIQ